MNEAFPFPILDLNGDAFARGVQHGKLARDRIHRTIESLNRVIGTALSPEEVATILEECRQHAAKYAPDLLEEVRGIAEGAGIDEADIFKINCYSELWYAAELAGADLDEEGCSTLAFAPPATGGETLLHWNCDFYSWWQDTIVLLRITQPDGRRLLMFAYAGTVGANSGTNDRVALCVNGIPSRGRRSGVPYTFICRRVVEQENIGQAIAAVITARRSTGSSKNFMLGSHEGQVVAIETSADDYRVIPPAAGVIGHSNHYATSEMHAYGRTSAQTGQSIARLLRIEQWLESAERPLGLESIRALSRDHANYPSSICRHSTPNAAVREVGRSMLMQTHGPDSCTLASMTYEVGSGIVRVTRGNPCENEPFSVPLAVGD